MYFPLRGSQTTIWLLGSKPKQVSIAVWYSCSGLRDRRHTLECEVADLEALVRALLGRDDGGVADQRIMDTRVGNKVGLELVQINIEGTIETQARGDRANNLSNQTVQMLIVGTRYVQAATADIVDGFVVNKECAVRVLNSAVGGENSVVRLYNRGRDARRRIYGEFELALLAVVGREALKQERTETGSCATTERVENKEALERRAVVYLCEPTDLQ